MEWKQKAFCPETRRPSVFPVHLCAAFVPSLKRVELLLGNLLYLLSSWSYSRAEKSLYTPNSKKWKSKALFDDCFQCNPASSWGPLSWEQPKQHVSVGCRSTWCEWQQLQTLPEHFPYLRCEHQAPTPFLLRVDFSLVLSDCLCSETRPGIDAAEKQISLPLPLCWAQLGGIPHS